MMLARRRGRAVEGDSVAMLVPHKIAPRINHILTLAIPGLGTGPVIASVVARGLLLLLLFLLLLLLLVEASTLIAS
jgi:hypothetical protein